MDTKNFKYIKVTNRQYKELIRIVVGDQHNIRRSLEASKGTPLAKGEIEKRLKFSTKLLDRLEMVSRYKVEAAHVLADMVKRSHLFEDWN
tara:strand:- start:12 stop:281 length:270 start_codon:yes stop_codon:yes gene_type:complete